MHLVDDEVAVEEELADVDRRRETTDMGKRVRLSISDRVDYSDIAEIEGKVGECREECEFGSVEVGLTGDETAYVVAHDRGECVGRKHDVADDDDGYDEYANYA